jgi:hypothetical protein
MFDWFPGWLFPSAYNTRKKMIENFKKWLRLCHTRPNESIDCQRDVEYDSVWGSTCIKRMVERHEELGFSDDRLASIMLGYLFMCVLPRVMSNVEQANYS